MGDAVNKVSKMCSKAMKEVQITIVVTKDFYENLSDDNKKFFNVSSIYDPEYYHADVVIRK